MKDPNQVWSIDFKGWFRTQDGERCDPLTICDGASRYLLCCQAMLRPDGAHVRPRAERSCTVWTRMGEIAAETVEFPDDEYVALPQGAQTVVESGPVVAYAGSEVVVEVGWVVDVFGPQGVALQVQRLGAICL